MSYLMPFLMSQQENQRQILQLIPYQANRVPLPTPPAALNNGRLVGNVILANNKDPTTTNHSSNAQESVTFLTRFEVEAIVRKETGSSSPVSTELMPLYATEVTTIAYPTGYKTPKFQKFVGCKGDSKEHVWCLLDSMGAFSYNSTLCLRDSYKSLTSRAYTWYANLRLGLVHDFEHFVSLLMQSSSMLRSNSLSPDWTVYANTHGKTQVPI